jgi:hypothetical protein
MMTRSTIGSLILLGLAASQVYVCQATISDITSLRAGGSNEKKGQRASDGDNDEREFKRQSVIRRLYGSENGEVRKHVRLLEEENERSRTGFMGDPYHEVPYENHPYQKTYDRRRHERQRHLQDTEFAEGVINTDGVTTTTTGGTDLFKPLRIRFETQALDDTRDAQNAAKIDFIKTKILPE